LNPGTGDSAMKNPLGIENSTINSVRRIVPQKWKMGIILIFKVNEQMHD
jgi:hypothetical protein